MTDETEKRADLPVIWHNVPSYFVDGVLGNARAGGIHRIAFGEVVFNPDPSAGLPAMRPVINLVLSDMALEHLVLALQEMQKTAQPTGDNDAD